MRLLAILGVLVLGLIVWPVGAAHAQGVVVVGEVSYEGTYTPGPCGVGTVANPSDTPPDSCPPAMAPSSSSVASDPGPSYPATGGGGYPGGGATGAPVYVNGYTTANGTVVPGYYRTAADSTTANNYSTRGNTNPFTGQPGTRSPSAPSGGGRGR